MLACKHLSKRKRRLLQSNKQQININFKEKKVNQKLQMKYLLHKKYLNRGNLEILKVLVKNQQKKEALNHLII